MKFKYQARTKEGEPQVGFVEAGTREAAAAILTGHQLFVLSVEETEKARWYDRISRYFGRVKRKDFVIFTRQMATLLEARLPLTDVLRTLHDQAAHPVLREAVFQISEDVDAGLSLSQALERQNQIFSGFFVSMIRSAEITGNLERVVGFLADYVEKEASLVTKARSALIYPGIIIALFVVVGFIMVTVVFPQIEPVFAQSGVEIPWFTQFLIGFGKFLAQWWPALVISFGLLLMVALDYFQTDEGKSLRDEIMVRTPLIKKIYLPLTITRIANTASMLLMGGVPVAQAIEIVGQTIGNVVYKEILAEISQEVREGIHLAEAVGRHKAYFPPLVPQMLSVGEATGQVDAMFTRISSFYGKETDTLINNLVDLIQPVLMIGIGLLVGILFASILLPLYQLTSTIQ
ncbi:MAG: type II secretion system F family protein [Patescibacteria group bacterium]